MRSFLGQLCLNVLIQPHSYPGNLEKTKEAGQSFINLWKRVKMDENNGFRRRDVGRDGICARQGHGRGCCRGGVNAQEELVWVHFTLTLLDLN